MILFLLAILACPTTDDRARCARVCSHMVAAAPLATLHAVRTEVPADDTKNLYCSCVLIVTP